MSNDTWFTSRWEAAESERREAAWMWLADDLLNQVMDGAVISPEIRAFLHDKALHGPRLHCDTATRLLGALLHEKKLDEPWLTEDVFDEMLISPDDTLRLWAAEACHASGRRRMLNLLAWAWLRETEDHCRSVMANAITHLGGDIQMEVRPGLVLYRDLVARLKVAQRAAQNDKEMEAAEDPILDEAETVWNDTLTQEERNYINGRN